MGFLVFVKAPSIWSCLFPLGVWAVEVWVVTLFLSALLATLSLLLSSSLAEEIERAYLAASNPQEIDMNAGAGFSGYDAFKVNRYGG